MTKVPKFLVVALLVACLAGAVAWTLKTVVSRDRAVCDGRNKALAVLQVIIDTSYYGPHRFNTAVDIHNRTVIYKRQTEKIKEARC